MFQRILVPTDLTDATDASLKLAMSLARLRYGARVSLLHVIERIPSLEDHELRTFYDRLERDACIRMREMLANVGGTDEVAITHHVVLGRRAEEIVRYAEANQMDLIILNHGHEAATPFGSVSYKVGILAPCAVLLAKSPPVPARRPIDSAQGERHV
jgi:nucleotide-binding universal stress UspA family protein